MVRLLLAAVLGGFIGLERELKHQPSRAAHAICLSVFGAAMFTILSTELAGAFGFGDHTRIAAQIIPGIGFIGAGSILHSRQRRRERIDHSSNHLCGCVRWHGLRRRLYYWPSFPPARCYLALHLLGWMEQRFNLKASTMNYFVVSDKASL